MNGSSQMIKVSDWIKFTLIVLIVSSTALNQVMAQTAISFNVLADIEISKAGEKSHYYYNEIDQNNIDYRIGFHQLNLIGVITFDSNWSFNSRLLMERDKGQKFNKFSVPQLNFQWISNKRKLGFTLGLFNNPFGSYNAKQLSTKKSFVGHPLAYSYYANISSKIGYLTNMGDVTKVVIDDEVQWGSSNLYYGGYTYGAQFSWNIKPAKINWKIAIVNGASNNMRPLRKPSNFGICSRLKIQPKYFWEQGFSVSYGSFMEDSEVSGQLDKRWTYTQTLIGTDFKLGKGFFEFSGEFIGAFYKVPQFDSEFGTFDIDALNLSSLSAYLDIKYELSFLPGSYGAYRIDHLRFGALEEGNDQNWDNNVLRHSLALGYHINKYILARFAVSTQTVENKTVWNKNQNTFRFVLTAHY